MSQQIILDGTEIKVPHNFEVNRYKLTKSGRTADGRMQMDYIATKREFTLTYNVISSDKLKVIQDILMGDGRMFFSLEYVEDGEAKSATIYPGALPKVLHRTDLGTGGKWYWQDVEFNLIEQ